MDATMANHTRAVFRDVDDAPEPTASAASLPHSIGGFRIVGLIGRGGMGTVYEAVQDKPRRTVALKVMHLGVGSRVIQQRFAAEVELHGRLRHPGIAQVFAAGTHAPNACRDVGPVPFFAMEFVDGAESITAWAARHDLSLRARIELFASVCEAVAHGHAHGVLHRDLKPQNILVDRHGQPKVIDFGVACSLTGAADDATRLTQAGQLLGTVQYMSPEQVAGASDRLDVRSDLYSLGVVLYELLCRRLPYDVANRPIHEASRIVCQVEPPAPGSLDAGLRGDVETLLLKLLDKDRDRRYDSVTALLDDLRRYLDGEPIAARPRTAFHHLRSYARRNRPLALLLVVLVTVIVVSGGIIGSLASQVQATRRQKEVAERAVDEQRHRAEQTRQELDALRHELAQATGMLGADPPGLLVLDEDPAQVAGLLPLDAARATACDVDQVLARLHLLEPRTAGHRVLRLELAENYERVADLLAADGVVDGGQRRVSLYQRSLDLTREVTTPPRPRTAVVVTDLGEASGSPPAGPVEDWRVTRQEGRLLAKTWRFAEAATKLVDARARCAAARAGDPQDAGLTLDGAAIAVDLGDVRAQLLDLDGARDCYREACGAAMAAGDAGRAIARRSRHRLVQIAAQQGDCVGAWSVACEAPEDGPGGRAEQLRLIALAHAACGRFADALQAADEAMVTLEPDAADERTARIRGRLAAEIGSYRRQLLADRR